jgi:hypothetical protein
VYEPAIRDSLPQPGVNETLGQLSGVAAGHLADDRGRDVPVGEVGATPGQRPAVQADGFEAGGDDFPVVVETVVEWGPGH